MITLDAATVLLQWAVGGLFFLWVTTRRREVGIGYGWTMRITFGLMAAGAVVVGLVVDPVPVREAFGAGVEAHEHPNIVVGNDLELVAGHCTCWTWPTVRKARYWCWRRWGTSAPSMGRR